MMHQLNINHSTTIVLHHSLTKDSGIMSWEAIRKYHINEKGWNDIGYHFGIELINDSYQVLKGRPLIYQGAHVRGNNRNTIGICCVGNYDEDKPTPEMYDKCGLLCAELVHLFRLNGLNIKGHRMYAMKSCPGKNFNIQKVLNITSAYLPML